MIFENQLANAALEITDHSWRKSNQELHTLCQENFLCNGYEARGFILSGKFHTLYDPKTIAIKDRRPLAPELSERGFEYAREREILSKDTVRIERGLKNALMPCRTEQDARDQLTDLCRLVFPSLKDMKRTREPAFLFRGAPLKLHDFKETMKLITFYWADRLVN